MKKEPHHPAFSNVMMDTNVSLLAGSGGVGNGDKPGNSYNPTDPTYSRKGVFFDDEEEEEY